VINPDDVTSFHPGQHNWDITNLPAILYQLHPTTVDQHPENWPKPPQMRDLDGNPMFDPADPTFPILDWTILPFHISTKEDPCVMAAWLRLDPRMSWKDIIARMVPDDRPVPNVLNMRVSRLNASLDIFPWRDSHKSQQKVKDEIKKGKRKPLTSFHTIFNTTRGLTPGWNWSEFEYYVPVTELKWVEFKGKLAHLNSTTDLVGLKYKPYVDNEKLAASEAYDVWYQYTASAFSDKQDQSVQCHTTRRGRPTIPRALAPVQPAVAPTINNSLTETNLRKRRRSLSQEGQPSKKQRNALMATTPDMTNAETFCGLSVLEHNHDSFVDTTEHWHFTDFVPRDTTAVLTSFPYPNEFKQSANLNLDERGLRQVYRSTGLDDYDHYTEQNLYYAEANINNFGNDAEHCIEYQDRPFDFVIHKYDNTNDDIDYDPAGHLLEPCPQSRVLTEEDVQDDPLLAGCAKQSTQWTYATQSVEPEEGHGRNLIFNEKNFFYIADGNIIDWIDTHPNDPKEYIHAVPLQFAQHDLHYMCCCTTKQYSN
jgi:hypothetical protein